MTEETKENGCKCGCLEPPVCPNCGCDRDQSSDLKEKLGVDMGIIEECEVTFGCECPYCDRNFGEEFDSHSEDCKIGKFLKESA